LISTSIHIVSSSQDGQQGVTVLAGPIFVVPNQFYGSHGATGRPCQFRTYSGVVLLHIEWLAPIPWPIFSDPFQQSRPEGAHQHHCHPVPQPQRPDLMHRFAGVV